MYPVHEIEYQAGDPMPWKVVQYSTPEHKNGRILAYFTTKRNAELFIKGLKG